MNEPVTASLTAFDAILVGIILLSALMGFARGFRREMSTFAAFTFAVVIATLIQFNFGAEIEARLSFLQDLTPFVSGLIISAGLFIVLYFIIATIFSSLGRLVQGLEGIGPLDRFGGVLFGMARAIIAMVLLTVLIRYFGVDDRLPDWITESLSYPHLANAASAVQIQAPEIAQQVQSGLPVTEGADTVE